jgi:hypothetical protein
MGTGNEVVYWEALWACETCQVWWASQSAPRRTRLLLDLPASLARHLPWHAYRGWKLRETAVCPCCREEQEAPLYGDSSAVHAGAAAANRPVS